MAKVDILMPVYNDQSYLEEAIKSVLSVVLTCSDERV